MSCEGASISHLKQPLIASAHTKLPTTQALRHSIFVTCVLLNLANFFLPQWSRDKDRFFREMRQILRHRCLLSEIKECDDSLKCLR